MLSPQRPACSRKGFTLVELLVVIAIIGVLTSIAIPAVMMVQRNAQRTNCLNNLRELGRATISYETQFKKYPSLFSTWQNPSNAALVELHPWVIDLLPSMDQQLIYDQIKLSGLGSSTFYVPLLNCPSDPAAERVGPELAYVANAGRADNYGGAGILDFKGSGVFYDRSIRGVQRGNVIELNSTGIRDGLSQTALFSENANLAKSSAAWNFQNPITQVFNTVSQNALYAANTAASSHPEYEFGMVWLDAQPSNRPFEEGKAEAMQNFGNPWALARPSSWHSQSFNMVFADGRVETIRNSIGYDVYAKMMTSDSRGVASALGAASIGIGVVDQSMFAQ